MKKRSYHNTKPITPAPRGVFTPGVVGLDGQPYTIGPPNTAHNNSESVPQYECGVYGGVENGSRPAYGQNPKSRDTFKGLTINSPLYEENIELNAPKDPLYCPMSPVSTQKSFKNLDTTREQNMSHVYDMGAELPASNNSKGYGNGEQSRNHHVYDMAAELSPSMNRDFGNRTQNEDQVHDMAASTPQPNQNDDEYSDDFSDDEEAYDDFSDLDDHIYESLEPYQESIHNDESTSDHLPADAIKPSSGDNANAKETVERKSSNPRSNVIKEFITTEEGYLRDLDVIVQHILKPLGERHELPNEIKLQTLFGNIEDVRQFSVSFLASLHSCMPDSTYEDAPIAKAFLEHASKMKEVYKIYCRNQDDSNALLQKYKAVPQYRVAVGECLNNAKDKINVCGLGSLLIKPVQRVLKYPLLLKELLKKTPQPEPGEDASNYRELIEANKIASDIATAINEAKRRKDLVKRYRSKSAGDAKKSGHIIHGIKKKSMRLSAKINHALSKPGIVDEAYNEAEQNFRNLHFIIANFLKNCDFFLQDYEDHVNSDVGCAETLVNFHASDQNRALTSYLAAAKKIANYYFTQFRIHVQQQVINPVTILSQRLKEPQAIMDKRKDKLLDYENCLNSADSKENTQMAKNVYQALNDQLLDEIPKVCQLSYKLLDTCLAELVKLQTRFLQHSMQELEESVCLCKGNDADMATLEKMQIMKFFNSVQEQALLQMKFFTIIPATLTEKLNPDHFVYNLEGDSPITSQKTSTQSLRQREYLMKTYQPNDLFVVVSDYWSPNKTDLNCSRDELLGVIKRQDPSGNNKLWFCDNAVMQGFVPCSRLKSFILLSSTYARIEISPYAQYGQYSKPSHAPSPQKPPPSPRPSAYSLREGLYGEVGGSNATQVYDEVPADLIQDEDDMLDDTEYGVIKGVTEPYKVYRYIVEFSHTSRSPMELSITKGDFVNVILQHDKDGNTEWWLVANKKGEQGFVPYNFIRKIE